MIKRTLTVFLLLFIIAGNVFAQEQEQEQEQEQKQEQQKQTEETAKNRIGYTIGLVGVELSYERLIVPHFSFLCQVTYNNWLVADSLAFSGKARWYPFGKTFYMDLGLGYSNGYNYTGEIAELFGDLILGIVSLGLWFYSDQFQEKEASNEIVRNHGVLIQPGLGWNIDIGKKNRFMMPIGMGMDIRVVPDKLDKSAFLPYFRLGLAYAF